MRAAVAILVSLVASGALAVTLAEELQRAQELAWAREFAQAERLYRDILERQPRSADAALGLARVVLWQGRYAEAIALFDAVPQRSAQALEGRGLARYWSGDLRRAARDFRRALALRPDLTDASRSLAEIRSITLPSQRIAAWAGTDDQPLDALRSEVAATFYSDPQTRWTASAGGYRLEAEHVGEAAGEWLAVANETTVGDLTLGGAIGLFEFPDGVRRPTGSASVSWRSLQLRAELREELATATAIRSHAASTNIALRWSHDRNLLAAAEISRRRYFDGNIGTAAVAYAVAPLRKGPLTIWAGASAAARDTRQSRFGITGVSSTFDDRGFFTYQYRGEYDPYWTPDDLVEARLVAAVERRWTRGGLKVHADGGYARDRGRAFGPDSGPGPFPGSTFSFAFDRSYHPWRAGITADISLSPYLRIEAVAERSRTVDYRSTTVHVALVRRR